MSIVIITSTNSIYDCLIYQYVCNIKTSFSLLLYICFSLERLIINMFLLFSGALVARSLVLYVVFCGSLFVLLSIVLSVLLSIVLFVLLSIVLSVLCLWYCLFFWLLHCLFFCLLYCLFVFQLRI